MARPKIKEDRPVLINMAEGWVSSGCKTPTRQLAEYFKIELPPAGFTKESFEAADKSARDVKEKIVRGRESTSKRLQVKFSKMVSDGTALKVGTYMELQAVRYRYRERMSGVSGRALHLELDMNENSPDCAALSAVATTLACRVGRVIKLAGEGRSILDNWCDEEQNKHGKTR